MKKLLFFLIVFYLSLLVISCSGGGGGESSSTSDQADTMLGDSDPDSSDSSAGIASTSCPSSSTYTLDSSSTADNTSITDSSSITDNSDVDNSTVRVCSTIIRSKVDNATVDNSTIIGSTVTNSTLDNSTIDNSTIDNSSTITNSTIIDSIIDNSTIINMIINNNSIVQDQELENDNLSGFTSSTRPTVSATYVLVGSTWTDGNGGTDLGANRDTDFRIEFSESMDPSSITVNTSSTSCSTGTIVVSKISDNFALNSCVQMSSSPTASNNNKWFTVEHNGCLANGGSYKIKVTTGVKDGSGNSMASDNTTGTGFGTNKLSCP